MKSILAAVGLLAWFVIATSALGAQHKFVRCGVFVKAMRSLHFDRSYSQALTRAALDEMRLFRSRPEFQDFRFAPSSRSVTASDIDLSSRSKAVRRISGILHEVDRQAQIQVENGEPVLTTVWGTLFEKDNIRNHLNERAEIRIELQELLRDWELLVERSLWGILSSTGTIGVPSVMGLIAYLMHHKLMPPDGSLLAEMGGLPIIISLLSRNFFKTASIVPIRCQ